MREVLQQVALIARDSLRDAQGVYAAEPPILRVISPLAEGADRIVAQEAAALGYELQCPLPFERAEYERDFATPESRAVYHDFLAGATAVLELDGSRETPQCETEAYEAVGRMVLNQCDALIAIWDGEEAQGRGGTAQIVREALQREIPTVWIHSQPPHDPHILASDATGARSPLPLDELTSRLRQILVPPHGSGSGEDRGDGGDLRAVYFAETKPGSLFPLGWVWRSFRDLAADLKLRRPNFRVANFEQATAEEWRGEWQTSPGLPASVTDQIDRSVRDHYAWADKLAEYYANLYRSSFVANYLLGVLVVLLAVLPIALAHIGGEELGGLWEWIKILVSLAAIVAILVIIRYGRRHRWHERSIDYRLLAELLRQLRFLAPLGDVPRFSRPLGQSFGSGDLRGTWMGWHLQAVARAAGMVPARFDREYLEAYRTLLHDALIAGKEGQAGGQLQYNISTAKRFERMNHHLHRIGSWTFLITLGLLVVLLTARFLDWRELHYPHDTAVSEVLDRLVLLEVFLPALGAALTAIRTQAEMERVVKRSEAMSEQLRQIKTTLERREVVLSSTALAQVAESAAATLINDVLDWRVLFQARPIELPA